MVRINSRMVKIVLILTLVSLFIFLKDLINFIHPIALNLENIYYYYYSSAAQAIATFIAFLIAGYALVYQVMNNLQNKTMN